MTTFAQRVEPLNALLKEELAAIASYESVLQTFQNRDCVELRRIEADHRNAADRIRRHIIKIGGEPVTSAGAWRSLMEVVTQAAGLFGHDAALTALRREEEHGTTEYETVVRNPHVDPECKSTISSVLLPRQRDHVPVLNRLMNGGGYL